MKLHVAICEDEPIFCEELKAKILELRPECVVSTYYRGDSLLHTKNPFEVVFMDIAMPGKDGMCTARELRERNYTGNIVFLSCHTDFMPDAFKVNAFRFLEKPIQTKVLAEVMRDLESEALKKRHIILKDYGSSILIGLSDICYIESQKNKTIVHTTQENIETTHTLRYWVSKLENQGFLQVHKSYIVSLERIQKIDDEYIHLRGFKAKIPISRRNLCQVKKAFFKYVDFNSRYM